MRRARTVHGFSTLELLVAMAVVVVVSTQALGLFAAQQRNAVAQREVVEVQDDARLITDLMTNDVRMAGFMVPKTVAVSAVDGGATDPDRLCVSDAGAIDPATLAGVTSRFGGTGLASDLGAASSVSLVAGEMDIDGNGTNDYAAGRGIIVSDGTRTHCARITFIAGGTVSFTPATPAGFLIPAASGRAVPAVVYEVTFNWLLRNGQLFVNGVEDLQVEFGVDTDGDGEVSGAGEVDLDGLDNRPTDQLRTVKLSVIVRTQRADLGVTGGKREQVANRNAGGADTFRRRLVTNTIAPRNLL